VKATRLPPVGPQPKKTVPNLAETTSTAPPATSSVTSNVTSSVITSTAAPETRGHSTSSTFGAGLNAQAFAVVTGTLPQRHGTQNGNSAATRAALTGIAVQSTPSEAPGRSVRAAVLGAVAGFALLSGGLAHAQSSTGLEAFVPSTPSVAEQVMPTGPPGATLSPLNLRLQNHTILQSAPLAHNDNGVIDAKVLSPEAQATAQRAYDNFVSRLDAAIAVNPLVLQGAEANDHQRDLMLDATKDFVRELPIGALNANFVGVVRDLMEARGLDATGLEGKRIKDLGSIAGDIGKTLADQMRDEHPVAFYGLAAAGASALVLNTIQNGTDAPLAITPKFNVKFLDGLLQARVRAEFEAKLANPVVDLSLRSEGNIGSVRVMGEAGVVLGGDTFKNLDVTGYSLGASAHSLDGTWGVNARYREGDSTRFELSGSYRDGPWTGSVGAVSDSAVQNGDWNANLSIGYQPSRDVRFTLGASHGGGNTSVNAGVNVRF
jgi:hypothetical protein